MDIEELKVEAFTLMKEMLPTLNEEQHREILNRLYERPNEDHHHTIIDYLYELIKEGNDIGDNS
mgnify:FL=1